MWGWSMVLEGDDFISVNEDLPPWTSTAGALLLSRFKLGAVLAEKLCFRVEVSVCHNWPGSRQVGLASETFLLVFILIWNLFIPKWGWESTSYASFIVTKTIQHMGKMLWKIIWISANSVLCQLITIYLKKERLYVEPTSNPYSDGCFNMGHSATVQLQLVWVIYL